MASSSSSNNDSCNENVLTGRRFKCFVDLMTNNNETFMSAGEILVRFANNVLKDPSNSKYRKIKLSNEIFMSKLLPVNGAVDCLFSMGFQEQNGDELFLDFAANLKDLHAIRDALVDEISKRSCKKTSDDEVKSSNEKLSFSTQQRIVAPTKVLQYMPRLDTHGKREFYSKLKSPIDQVFLYENKELQKLARSVIPIKILEEEAINDYKNDIHNSKDKAALSEKDYFLLRLLAWFKKDFFSWTNSPKCNKCKGKTKFHSRDVPNVEEMVWHCGNVECYQCLNCSSVTRFPRYNHPQKLLETRTGRCGEWANCFTLCCRAVGLEARYVLDFTDHVWTEVYSDYQKRWLHCDSCENVCDKPLLYETGWNKKLSYVIAFSKDEIIDVTWRYSCHHEDIVIRRKTVPENWLIDFYLKASEELQSIITDEERKAILMNRHIVEIVEFISPRNKSNVAEGQGRISGSLAWRTARGEAGKGESTNKKSYVFQPTELDIKSKRMKVQYFPAKDHYVLNDSTTIPGWENCVNCFENIFRKVEADWKMVYLARTEGSEMGKIRWSFDIHNTNLKISNVNIKINSKLYESGKIDFKLHNESNTMDFSDNIISTDVFSGSKVLHLDACLKGSTGDVAWQHSQLFRCADSDETYVGLEFDISLSE